MCNNYIPVQAQLLRDVYGVEPPAAAYPPETWPDYMAPIVRLDAAGGRQAVLGNFGMMPKSRIPSGVKPFDTTNARSETVGERRTFSAAWKNGQLCLAPASALFEPNYESGPKSVRYRIWARDQENFAIAGLWRDWPDGFTSWTMLTVNAENHPLMRRMHAPGKEKRSVVILHRDQWDDWLNCSDPEVARTFLNLYPADLMDTEPAPRASRKSKPHQASDQATPDLPF
ncbi:SOS response-associated peptidase family protein [Cupriavidus necator]|uniref:SOS response-associated peptidase n=1 Tax=Cupriavidus necator TaxID=106590 RepID=UPI00339DA349